MMKLSWKLGLRILLLAGVTAGIVASILLVPGVAMGLSATIQNNKEAATPPLPPNYKLGETVQFTSDVVFAAGEMKNIDRVLLRITGPQPVDVDLPVVDTGGLFNDYSYLLPQDGGGHRLGSLKAKIEFQGVTAGYGYIGSGAGGRIRYTIKYVPPAMLYPPPAPLPGPINNPDFAFAVPGATSGGNETADASVRFAIPDAPGVAQPAQPLGLAFVQGGFGQPVAQFLVLMEGSPVDIILFVDPWGGFLNDFLPLDTAHVGSNISDATGVAVMNGDIFVLRNTESGKLALKVRDVTPEFPPADTMDSITVPGSVPGGDIVFSGGHLYEVDNQPTAGAGIPARKIDPYSGTVLAEITVPDSPSGGGYTAGTALDDTGTDFLGGFLNTIVEFSNSGMVQRVVTVNGVTDIQGMAIQPGGAPGAPTVLIADGATSSVYEVTLASANQGGPIIPRAIASDNSSFYILEDGSPADTVVRVDRNGAPTGTQFDVASDQVESLVQFGNKLFYVDNAASPKQLRRVSPSGNPEAVTVLPVFVMDIGDLTTDGTYLYGVERWSDRVHKISPDTASGTSAGSVVSSFNLTDTNMGDPYYQPGGLEALVQTPGSPAALLIGGKYGTTWRLDLGSGNIVGGDQIMPGPPWDLTGMTLVGNVIYMTDASTQAVYKAARPNAPASEMTAVGNYQALIQVFVGGSVEAQSEPNNFTLEKVESLVIDITSPANGSGSATPNINVQGTVNDPTVSQVTVGVALPEAVLFGNADKSGPSDLAAQADRDQYTNAPAGNLWKFIDFSAAGSIPPGVNFGAQDVLQRIGNQRGQVAWYGKFELPPTMPGSPPYPNYNTGFMPNVGALYTSQFSVGASAKLTFDTWFETDPGYMQDQKLIRWCPSGGAPCQTIAQINPDFPMVPMVGGGYQPDFGAAPGTIWQMPPWPGSPAWKQIYVPMSRYNTVTGDPQFTPVTIELASLGVSGSGKIGFEFNTVDEWSNDYKGWMIDGVQVSGDTTVGKTVAVDPETLTWTAPFTLAEGENNITATASRTAYAPTLTASDTVTVYLDTAAPVVHIVPGGALITNVAARTLEVTYTERTPDRLVVTVNGRPVLDKRTGFNPPQETLSQPISLAEGANTIVATMTDQSSLTGTDTVVVTLDTVGPVVTVLNTIYPVGQVSARAGDMVIMQANVTDAGSGVQKVEFIPPGQGAPGPGNRFVPAGDVPSAVRDQWGSTGQYLLPFDLGSSVAPGTFNMTMRATDNAGNTRDSTVSATVVATLQAFNIYLMPGYNLVSLPLQPVVGTTFNIATLLQQPVPNTDPAFRTALGREATLADVIESISYWPGGNADSGADWQIYTTDPSGDTLTGMTTGAGYWIKMKDNVFKLSDPLAAGLPQTPAPMKLTITGQVLRPGEVPPTYSVVAGWNLVGLHAEKPKTGEQFLRGVSVPETKWASLLEFQNYLKFAKDTEPEIKLGAFNSLFEADTIQPGRGFWLYMVEPGNIVP